MDSHTQHIARYVNVNKRLVYVQGYQLFLYNYCFYIFLLISLFCCAFFLDTILHVQEGAMLLEAMGSQQTVICYAVNIGGCGMCSVGNKQAR